MPETIHEYTARYRDEDGTSYAVLAVGERRDDGVWGGWRASRAPAPRPRPAGGERRDGGMWEGWIEFHPLLPPGQPVRTGRETTQPNRDALVYWASGLEPVYFEGAFSRARYPGVTTPG